MGVTSLFAPLMFAELPNQSPLLTMFSHNHIYIAKYLFYIRDDWLKNLEKNHCPGTRNVLVRLPFASQKRTCLIKLPIITLIA